MQASISTHPTDQVLRAFGNGQLDPASAESVTTHLDECEECLRKVAGLSSDGFLEVFRKARPRWDTEPHRSGLDRDQPPAARRPSLASTEAMSLPPGAEIPSELANHPDYTILHELGRGGMGIVYLAQNKLMGRQEALKVVSSHVMNEPGVLDRFHAEIRTAAQLEHPNVVTAYSALRLGERVGLAMQYVEGLDLARLVDSRGPLPVANACYYVHQAALGLQHAHEHGMVHRDIKPSNLMLTRQGNRHVIKVLDFGLAKVRSEGSEDGTLTHKSQILGTPDFIAPEQIRNTRRADIRADIYSLGCTLYFLLTGGPPFQGPSLYDTLQAHHSMDAKPLNLVRPDVPVELAALVAKMMAKEPERRFQEPKEVAQALIPFFKKGASRPSGPSAEMSADVSHSAAAAMVETASAPPQSPPLLPTVNLPAPRASKIGKDGVAWLSLIEIKEDETRGNVTRSRPAKSKPAPAEGPVRRPPWMWPAIVAASMLGLVALGVIIITIRDKNGVTTITAPDDKAFRFEKDGVIVENKPARDRGPSTGSGNAPEILGSDKPSKSTSAELLPPITNSIGMKLVLIPAGEFWMGSPDDAIEADRDESPQHRVWITRPFYLGACEVTQAQYEAVMGKNPSHFSATGGGADRVGGQLTPDYPVESVSWFDAIHFCNKLSEKEGMKSFYEIDGADVRVPDWNGQGYRLPTEAEWEYACRAGTSTVFSFGNRPTQLREYDWFHENSEQRTHPVGLKRPNPFGLRDMYGNVWEWCWDSYLREYYAQSPSADPTGPVATDRVIRGGSIGEDRNCSRSAERWPQGPGDRGYNIGFRLARGAADRREPKTEPASGTSASPVPKPEHRVENSIGMKLVLIPKGEFLMGSADDAIEAETHEKPLHRVRISKPFYFGVCEVTQAQYEAVMGKNPSHFSATGGGADRVGGQLTPDYPVESVSWFDAIHFCNKLSEKEGMKSFYEIDGADVRVPDWNGQGYRLPTEAEWEYACRANASPPTRFSFGDSLLELPAHAWCEGNCEQRAHPVGQKPPNPFGLYDMHGNVWEWCWDWYLGEYYAQSPSDDPTGPVGTRRVLRGGGILADLRDCRSAWRGNLPPGELHPDVGFRVARGAAQRLKFGGPMPFACWTFEPDARDVIGSLHGSLKLGAQVRDGRLYLDGKGAYVRTAPLSRLLREKTLEAWVILPTLRQNEGGIGVISVERLEKGETFDALLFGREHPRKWTAGSEWGRRTRVVAGPDEAAKPSELIHLAVVYDASGGIALYRQGRPYGERYVPTGPESTLRAYPPGESYVLLGRGPTLVGCFLNGAIEEARLYDRALTADEVAASYRAGIIHGTNQNCVANSSETGPAAGNGKDGATSAPADAAAATATPELPGKPAETSHPFRIPTNGLAGRPSIDPITFGPDGLGRNDPGTARPWVTKDAFAQITTGGTLGYPRLPASRYVFEVELTVNRRCYVQFQLGDAMNACHISLRWNSDLNKVRCNLSDWQHGWWSTSDGRDFAPGARISLKLVVGDGNQTLFHDGAPMASRDCWPTDCCLRIFATPDSAVIHRCSIRPLTAQDVAACGWPIPPTRLPLDDSDARERLRRIFAGYPERPKAGKRFAVKTTGTPMAWVPPGTFEMGSRDPNDDGWHRVRLTKGYWMAQIEVTQGAYQKVTGANPSRVTGSDYLPVDWVAWDEAAAYCRKLTDLERAAHRLPDGYEYRLPTEAEWEYACRAGSDPDFSVPPESVWSRERSGGRPHEVAESQPNAWGLYDMHGNAMEWCLDAWSEYPQGKKEVTVDPFKIGKPDKDTTFVARGGAWWAASAFCASNWRYLNHNNANGFRGFRIVSRPAIRDPSQ